MNEFNALVIGGGPAGATAALLLARAGWSVAVVEKSSFPRRKVCGEFLSATNWPLLHELGVAEAFRDLAGPDVREVGLFVGKISLVAPMPQPPTPERWGRALGREHLDTMMLERARQAGAQLFQPCAVAALAKDGEDYVGSLISKESDRRLEVRARTVIAAHGSWESGSLPTQGARAPARESDLLGFKAHFRNCHLPAGVMPLLCFPGGYGGMVWTDNQRVSLSCCIRRGELERCRRKAGVSTAGPAVLGHIQESCREAQRVLADATLDGDWLSAGPIRPGVRRKVVDGILAVGNAAGEAHPIVAEGISMAMQSAWLLCQRLKSKGKDCSERTLMEVGSDYAAAWDKSFSTRIRAAALFARLAMSSVAVTSASPLLRLFPRILTRGAQWSGKAKQVVPRA
jgi:flavin-dependent dehydrogenase